MATAAIKPSAEVACKLCRGGAVKTEGQQLKALKLFSRVAVLCVKIFNFAVEQKLMANGQWLKAKI